MKITPICIILAALLATPAFAEEPMAQPPATGPRKATLAWGAIDEAAKYEVQLAENRKFSPALKKQVIEQPQWTIDLTPGTYYFRVRPIDAKDLPGPWSDIEAFVVNPQGPRLVTPPDNIVLNTTLPKGNLKLEWTPGLSGTRYVIEIKDAQGPVLKRSVDSHTFFWKPQEAGTFQWRAGYESITGTEWSAFRTVTIHPDALGIAAKAAPPRAEVFSNDSLCRRVSLPGFQLAGIGAAQITGGRSFSGFASWNPRCAVSSVFEMSLSLGGTIFKSGGEAGANMTVVEYAWWATVAPRSGRGFSAGFGAGAETWVDYGTFPLIGLRLGARPDWSWLPFAEEWFVEYGYLFAKDKTHVGKFGLMLRWGNYR